MILDIAKRETNISKRRIFQSAIRPDSNDELANEMIDGVLSDDPERQLDTTTKFRDAVPEFTNLLSSSVLDVREKAVWALGNIAGDTNTTNRVCGGETPQPDWELISPCLTVLMKLIYSLEYDISIDACWVISYLSDVPTSNDKIQAAIESGVCRHPCHSSTKDDLQTEVVIASGALPTRLALLSSLKDDIRKEACWTISKSQPIPLPRTKMLLLRTLSPFSSISCKTRTSQQGFGGLQEPSQIRYLVSQGCIKPLCDLLIMMVIQVALDGLDNFLKVGEMDKAAAGLGASNLRQHEKLEIYKKAYNIMLKYFPDDEDDNTAIVAPVRSQ
ncbi:ARM repeat-containing protein [Lentinula raphanica]|nr:ARM repeat-containing protein [Lentinula raphanica]